MKNGERGGDEAMNAASMFWPLVTPGLCIGILALWRSAGLGTIVHRGHPWLASGLEVRAFHRLEQRFAADRHLISAHMLLADVVGRQNLDQLSANDRQFAWRAHCDFVIVSRDSLTIEKVVEINGGFHQNPQQKIHDGQKRDILSRLGITLEVWD